MCVSVTALAATLCHTCYTLKKGAIRLFVVVSRSELCGFR